VDVSEIAQPQDWQDEMLRPGRARRMLERWFAKFNCKEKGGTIGIEVERPKKGVNDGKCKHHLQRGT
jgi:hypothetical protein